MEERIINEKESVALIAQMIRNTQSKLEAGSGNLFLIWGYSVTLVSILVYALFNAGFAPWCFWLWFLIPVVGYSIQHILRKNEEPGVVTFIDKILKYIWGIIFIVAVLVPVIYVSIGDSSLILHLESLVLSLGVTITGLVIRFKPVMIGGMVGILLAFGFLLPLGANQILLFIAMAIITMVIPGHILNYKSKENKKG